MKLTFESQFSGPALPLLKLMKDPFVTDVLINGMESVYFEREGRMNLLSSPFCSESEVFEFLERIVFPTGRQLDATRPFLDGQLLDGSRFHIVLHPIVEPSPAISIRKFRKENSIELDAFAKPTSTNWLKEQLSSKQNVLISGATSSGKTTLLNCLLETVAKQERIIVIEETREIFVRHPHAIYLQARPPTPDGIGEVKLETLVRNALRMRPDRMVLGECRGVEAFELISSFNTGHGGGLSTIHANSAFEALSRLESLLLLSHPQLSPNVARRWVSLAIGVVVHLEKSLSNRKIREIIEVHGIEEDQYCFTPIFD